MQKEKVQSTRTTVRYTFTMKEVIDALEARFGVIAPAAGTGYTECRGLSEEIVVSCHYDEPVRVIEPLATVTTR